MLASPAASTYAASWGHGCAWYCFSIGIKHTSALQAGFIALAEPVMAPIWTYLFLGEQISTLSFIGFAVVIVTLVLYNASAVKGSR